MNLPKYYQDPSTLHVGTCDKQCHACGYCASVFEHAAVSPDFTD